MVDMENNNRVESRVAQTILQDPRTITLGGKQYRVAPPTIATLIRVSELVARMPFINDDKKDIISETLRVAKDCAVMADIFATIILGAKRPKYGFLYKNRERTRLAKRLLHEVTPKEFSKVLSEVLVEKMDIGFFLGISTSLAGINNTKPTRNRTTAYGQS